MQKCKVVLTLVLIALLMLMPVACTKRKVVYNGETVYYTEYGKCYHSTKDCPTLNHSNEIKTEALDILFSIPKADACDVCVMLTDEQLRDVKKQEEAARFKALYDEFESAADKYKKSFDAFVDAALGSIRYSNMPGKYKDWNKKLDKVKENLIELEDLMNAISSFPRDIRNKQWLGVIAEWTFEKHRNDFVALVEAYNKGIERYNDWAREYNINFSKNEPYLDAYYASKYTEIIDFNKDGIFDRTMLLPSELQAMEDE